MINIKRLSNSIGIDGAIAFTILTRLIQAGGGIISIVFIANFLSADEQGYYYTFGSILAIQIFFELGLSGIITQYAAHEFAHLKWTGNFELLGDEKYKSRASSLLRFFVKWFGIIAIILFFVLLVAGRYFFSKFDCKLNIEWQKPWLILCLSTSLNLFIDPILAFFDGMGEIKDMARVRLIQKGVNIILLFVFFALGFKLYSSALASLIAILVNYIQILCSNRVKFLKTVWSSNSEWIISYMQEIFPYQWRIALSWISGYFIFQLFNPILFATEGPKVAGQMGMTLQVLNGIMALSMSWITTKVPLFSNFIAHQQYDKLDLSFNITLKNLLMVNAAMLFGLNIMVYILSYCNIGLAARFLPQIPTIIFSAICFVNQLVFAWATYLRCHKKEPFLVLSIVTAILTSISTVVLGNKFGLMGITIGYGVIVIVITSAWAYLIFVNKKKEWHYQA